MRLISQDRKLDIPYETVILGIYENPDGRYFIEARNSQTGRLVFWLGAYSMKAQAECEMLGPANLYQKWVAASLFTPTPEPKVYFFGEDLGNNVEPKEPDFGEKVLMGMAEVIRDNLKEKGE